MRFPVHRIISIAQFPKQHLRETHKPVLINALHINRFYKDQLNALVGSKVEEKRN